MKNQHPRTQFAAYLTAACFALAPVALAVDPPPDGGYPGRNTAEGEDALFSLTTGTDNTAMGFEALFSVTVGGYNTAVGQEALADNTGSFNTAIGFNVLSANTTAAFNTAIGAYALFRNTGGSFNTAIGGNALMNNTTGANSTAIGFDALINNTTGSENTVAGNSAMFHNATGTQNTAIGKDALEQNEDGNSNTAIGYQALFTNLAGNSNTAIGNQALFANNGKSNTAIGLQALVHNVSGNNNIALGFNAGENLTAGSDNIDIGNAGVSGESKTIRIGTAGTQTATFIAGIRETPLAQGVAVAVGVTANGQLGVRASSSRFKEGIKPMDEASKAILALQPVTLHYKKELDPQAIPQFGLVAEQVAKVDLDLVARDAEGKPFTVRYDEVNAMLLNEFLKEHRKVQELEATGAAQQKGFESRIAALTAALKAQTAQIQKVSDQLKTQAPAPRVVAND
jgi:hypothetical protein